MKKCSHRDSGSAASGARRKRARPTPKWLTGRTDLDEVAQRRCLMILSVLSGERPVTEVVEENQISRQLYYLLETRALNAMLSALSPGAENASSDPSASSPAKRIVELEEKVQRLEQSRRRGEHLLFLTRQVLGKGPVKVGGRGRPRKSSASSKPRSETSSKTGGSGLSAGSTTKTKRASARRKTDPTTPASPTTSTASPTPDGAAAP